MSGYLWAETVAGAAQAAKAFNCDPAWLLAIAEVESRCDPGERGRPLIRFEAHYFKRYATATGYARASANGLLTNPRSQIDRWRQFEALREIDRDAAIKSHSFGLCQVMGANYQDLGFASPLGLMDLACQGPEGQFKLGANFLAVNHLIAKLAAGDLVGFAARYNGPNWQDNNYVNKLKAAYARHRDQKFTELPSQQPQPPIQPPKTIPVGQGLIGALLVLAVALGAFWDQFMAFLQAIMRIL